MVRIDQLSALRTHLYHLTAWSNLPGIQAERGLHPAATTLAEARLSTTERRRRHTIVRIGGRSVHVRDQTPLHEGSIAFDRGWGIARLVEHINSHVFFWPGSVSGPIASGLNHYARYASERPAILRIPIQSLLRANAGRTPLFCRFNSGAPRVSGGKYSPRGASTYAPASRFPGTRSQVIEVVFRGFVALPEDTAMGRSPSGNWQRLYTAAA